MLTETIRTVVFCAAMTVMMTAQSADSNLANYNGQFMRVSPPVAKIFPKVIETHGDKRIDNYFWLREKTNAEVTAYLESENKYADHVTGPLKGFREELYNEILGHLKETDSSAPVRRGEFLYYTRTEKGKSYPIYCRKRGGLDAPEEIVLNL